MHKNKTVYRPALSYIYQIHGDSLGMDNTAYPQPLTFDVTQYLVHDIKKPFEITIEK